MPSVGAGPVSELDENCAIKKEFLDLAKHKKCLKAESTRHEGSAECRVVYMEPQGEGVMGDSVLEPLWVGTWGVLEGNLGRARGEGVITQEYWA